MDNDNKYTQSGDPSNAIFDNAKASIRPDFDNAAKEASANTLRDAENESTSRQSGAKSANSSGGNISSAKEAEESSNNPNGFANKVTGQNGPTKTTKGKAKGRNKGPIIAIIVSLFGMGGLMSASQAFMPFSLISQFQEHFDSIGTSQNRRSNYFLKHQLDRGLVKDPINAKVFSKDKFKISDRQRKKLARQNIEVNDEYEIGGKKRTVMEYTDAKGNKSIVVADKSLADADNGIFYFKDLYDADSNFRNSYFEGAKTWRGSVGAWFDNLTKNLLSKIGISRGKWASYDAKTNDIDDVKDTLGKSAGELEADGKIKNTDIEEGDVDPDTNETGDPKVNTSDIDPNMKGGDSPAELKAKIDNIANSKVTKAADGIANIANYACIAADVVGAIGLIVAASEMGQILQLASGIFESFQKAQIGDGEQSPIHELSNQLTTNAITEHYGDNYDPEDNPTDIKKTEGSAMEAEGITSLYSGKAVNGNDESVKTFNIWGNLKKSMGAVGIAMDSFMACTYAKMAAATVNIIGDGLTVAACIASGGIACIVSAFGKGYLVSEVAQFLVPAIVGFFLPKIANYYTRNLTEDLLGVDLGNAIASGGHAYMGKNGQYGGNSVASKDSLLAYMVENEKVIAENARYERETRSPFDITSQYTFLGSIVNNLAPYQSKFSSLTGIILSIGDMTTNSLSSIIPGASAAELANTVSENAKNTAENCPFLESIGGVGDAFCNPYFITDTTTLEEDPTEIIEELNNDDQFENSDQESEVPTIKDGSKLSYYIVYCGQRESTFGIADQNIAGQFDSSTGNNTADGLLGAVPFVGDTMDIFSNGNRVKNMGYITGEACVTGAKAPAGSTWSSWEETKKYQRFVEDQRLLENMGLIEKSSVTAYLEEYYEKHPLDNSYEGILARRSGLTKDQVIAYLDKLDYLAKVVDYDPTNKAPILKQEAQKPYRFHINSEDNAEYILGVNNYYIEDRKIKNFAV